MAAWITYAEVGTIVRRDLSDDDYIAGLIDHVQGLAEAEIGTQDAPSTALKSTFAEIVARKWRAGIAAEDNPAGNTQDQAGPFGRQQPQAGAAGLGLTDREIRALRRAAGVGGLAVQPLSRGDNLETAGPGVDPLEDPTDPIDQLAAAQGEHPWFP